MNRIRNIIRLLLCVLLVSLSSCDSHDHVHGEDDSHDESVVTLTEAQYKMAGIKLGKSEERSMSGLVKVNGVLDVPPQNLVTVSLPYAGIVRHTKLLQGLKVKKGDVIAVLEHPDFIQLQQDYLDSKSRLEYLEQEVQRQEELQKENINSTKVFQKAKADYESLKAIVSGLKQKLNLINISTEQLQKNGISSQVKLLAPIDGYVTVVNINIGKFVNPNDVICEIVDISHLHVELTVFEKDITSLKKGQKVLFLINNETQARTASVYLVGKEISPDRTVRVHCHLDEEDTNLLPGMYLTANIETSQKYTKALPSRAIVFSQGKNFVFVYQGKNKDDYSFQMKQVQIGVSDGNYTEVSYLEKVDSNSEIVLEGAYDLLSAKNVNKEEGHSH